MSSLNVLSANVRKVGIEMLRYLPNTISEIITFYASFLLFFLGIRVIGGVQTTGGSSEYLIVSIVLWVLALTAMQGIGWEITNEATRGTLEQLYMSPVGTWKILLSRMTGRVVVEFGIILIVLVLNMLTAGVWLTFDLLTLAPLLVLTVVCMLGVGFMVAGLALVFKQIQALLQIAQFVFFALVAVPVSLSPWLEALPVVRGSTMIRAAMTEGVTLVEFSSLDWALLVANTVFYFALGIFLYRLAERRAMNKGLLGQY
ncbi:hypothetical protein BH24DEI2_BH24DEI2_17030 [soil metagenome]